MKKSMMLFLALGLMYVPAWGDYQLRINGTPVADYGVPGTLYYTATVGQPVRLEIWSNAAQPVSVDPDTVEYPNKYEAFQLSTTVLPTYTIPPDKLSNVEVNYALTGPYAVAPYGNQQTLLWIGWTQTPTETVGPGLWFSADWTPIAEGERQLSIFCYLLGWGKNPNLAQQHIRLTQVPPKCDPALTADLNGDCWIDIADLAILASQWLDCGVTDPNDTWTCAPR